MAESTKARRPVGGARRGGALEARREDILEILSIRFHWDIDDYKAELTAGLKRIDDDDRLRHLLEYMAAPHLVHGAESDIGLGQRGRQQAEAVAPVLAAGRPVAVISSPMRRAVETAEPIARVRRRTLSARSQRR